MSDGPSHVVIEAVMLAANRHPIGWERVTRGGYTPAERWVVTFDNGTRAFAKVGTVEHVGEWLRTEHRAYRDIAGPFMPHLLGWSDTPVAALLLEDLSDAFWPPPWSEDRVARIRAMLDEVAATRCPSWAPAAGHWSGRGAFAWSDSHRSWPRWVVCWRCRLAPILARRARWRMQALEAKAAGGRPPHLRLRESHLEQPTHP